MKMVLWILLHHMVSLNKMRQWRTNLLFLHKLLLRTQSWVLRLLPRNLHLPEPVLDTRLLRVNTPRTPTDSWIPMHRAVLLRR